MKQIYLDHNATTPIDPSVLEVMIQELSSGPRNASSPHFFGQEARKSLLNARQTIARFLRVKPNEIFFTSGGTESMNLLIQGMLLRQTGHVITTNIDHASVFESVKAFEKNGWKVTYLSPGQWGTPTPEQVKKALRCDTRLIVLSAVNGETGVKLELEAIAKIAQATSIPLIIDGVALLGKELFTIPHGVTGMGFSAHKIHGPKGVGFFYLRSGSKLSPLFHGGGQEKSLRSGTENLPGILGLAKAISLLEERQAEFTLHMKTLRDLFEQELKKELPTLSINGKGPRIANTSNICFRGIDGETLLIYLDREGLAASHASACSSGAREISPVLLNMGIPRSDAESSIRFSLSRMNTQEEILQAVNIITKSCHLIQSSITAS